jgi:hypothetical protein
MREALGWALIAAGCFVVAATLLTRLRRAGEETPQGASADPRPTAGVQARVRKVWEFAKWGLVLVIAGLLALGFEYDRAVAVVLIAGAIGGRWRAFLAATGHASDQSNEAVGEESALRRWWRTIEPFVDFLFAGAAFLVGIALLLFRD